MTIDELKELATKLYKWRLDYEEWVTNIISIYTNILL